MSTVSISLFFHAPHHRAFLSAGSVLRRRTPTCSDGWCQCSCDGNAMWLTAMSWATQGHNTDGWLKWVVLRLWLCRILLSSIAQTYNQRSAKLNLWTFRMRCFTQHVLTDNLKTTRMHLLRIWVFRQNWSSGQMRTSGQWLWITSVPPSLWQLTVTVSIPWYDYPER